MQQHTLGYEIRTLSNLLKRKVCEVAPPPDENSVTQMQGQIAGYLYNNRNREVFQKDLEENFCIRRSTASRYLKAMEANGMVQRVPVAADARLKRLILTPKAISFHDAIEEKIQAVERIMARGLTEDELAQFYETIAKIKKNLL